MNNHRRQVIGSVLGSVLLVGGVVLLWYREYLTGAVCGATAGFVSDWMQGMLWKYAHMSIARSSRETIAVANHATTSWASRALGTASGVLMIAAPIMWIVTWFKSY